MSIELGQLKSILETAKKLQNGEIKTPTTLKGLIDNYNLISYNNGNPTDLPTILPFDEKNDISWDYISLAGNGPSKLANLIVYTEGYINAHTPIPPTIKKVEGWSKGHVITIVGIIIAPVIGLSYNQGANSKEKELYDERESLKTEKNELQKNNSDLNDSIISLNRSLDALQNVKQLKETLNDSILSLSKKNELYVDSIKRQNQKLDSLQHKLSEKTTQSDGLYMIYKQASDSLAKGLKRRKK
ncbi:hypothetical protein SAMN05720473_11060 [Fibrobacter sp. UWB15]|nr:hypothetical protein [Fibrobacter sp. UWB6]PWJ62847.1 hypothetical protein BGW99_11060 [Fibrobacter sp. UWB6]SHG45409.1 hypothetical protein SAMN05720760_11160 [Fibrobacter sp. UWB8]SMG39714.1 hypothetical protein SAMN05720473_11060 [Fibrobacter sp. UWB15]